MIDIILITNILSETKYIQKLVHTIYVSIISGTRLVCTQENLGDLFTDPNSKQ